MKKLTLAFSLLLAFTGTVSAADLGPVKAPSPMIPAVYDWTGFYTGINAGGSWGRKCWDRNTGLGGVFLAAEGCHDASGAMGGGQFGDRWQTGPVVFGLEAQGDGGSLTGSNTSLVQPAIVNHSRLDAVGLFTGQVGFAWNNALF
jgi:outer membrane immunogenic protein